MKISAQRRVSEITFTRDAHNRKIGKPNNLVLGAIKPKGLNRRDKMC
jgi:hypothetical protein